MYTELTADFKGEQINSFSVRFDKFSQDQCSISQPVLGPVLAHTCVVEHAKKQ